jgi:hypothetical protein
MLRMILVATTPGCSEFDVARVPCKRFESSSENRPFASFEWP